MGDTTTGGQAAGTLRSGLEQVFATAGIRQAGLLESVLGVLDLSRRCEGLGSALEIERSLIEGALRSIRPLLEGQLQRCADRLDTDAKGGVVCRSCRKGRTHSIGRRKRGWMTLAGHISLTRKGFECSSCLTCDYPAQRQLGLGSEEHTPRFQEALTMLATTVPHEMAVKLAGELFSVTLSETGVQDMVERRARGVARLLCEEVAAHPAFNTKGLPTRLPVAASPRPPRVYLEIDGVLPMTREELSDAELTPAQIEEKLRAKSEKARGGKGRKYRLTGREVKVAVLYEEAAVAQESDRRGVILKKHYVTHLGDAQTFASLVWAKLVTTGLIQAAEIVIVSDGSEWIRNLATELPIPGRVQFILDLFHVKHRLWEVAHALKGEHTPEATAWAQVQCARIEAGQSQTVLDALRFVRARGTARELVRALSTYLRNNLDRIDYPTYRANGLRVGSGAVESANYHVIGARMKTQGCRWSEAGARDMAYLRADLFNNQWGDRTRALLAA